VVAIKDGAMGHSGRGATSSANTLEAERNDRISRLAGLERVATARSTPSGHLVPGAGPMQQDNPQFKEMSTVGTASATGSIGGKTTWASEMDYDGDKMSEDQDDGVSSVGGLSDEDKASLVGFGEGAGSTVSGPVSTANARMLAARNSMYGPPTPRTQPIQSGGSTPMSGIVPTTASNTDPNTMDGITFDQGMADATLSPPLLADQSGSGGRFSGVGTEVAENVMQDRMNDSDRRTMGTPPDNQSLGRFGFEKD